MAPVASIQPTANFSYLVFKAADGRRGHLGSTDTGMTTGCGRQLDPAIYDEVEPFGKAPVHCGACQRSGMYDRAEADARCALYR